MLSNNCIKLAFLESIGCKTHSLFISDIFRWSNAPWILVEEIKGHSRLAGKTFHPSHPTLTLSHLDLSLTSRTLNSEKRWWASESHYGDSHISLNVTVMHKTIWHRGLEVKTPPWPSATSEPRCNTINKSHDFKFVLLFWNPLQSFQVFCAVLILLL